VSNLPGFAALSSRPVRSERTGPQNPGAFATRVPALRLQPPGVAWCRAGLVGRV